MKLVRSFLKPAAICLTGLLLVACNNTTDDSAAPGAARGSFQTVDHGVVITPAQGQARTVRLQVYADDIIRVTASPVEKITTPDSIMVVAQPQEGVEYSVTQQGDHVILRTAALAADVSLANGVVHFMDKQGQPLLTGVDSGRFAPVTADTVTPDADSVALRQVFAREHDEALYGLGQQQNGQVNLAGENVELTTYNLVISIPFLLSTHHYGILWDNNAITHFGDPESAKPLADTLALYDADGQPGGLTARYYDGDRLLLTRVEKDLDYQFLSHGSAREVALPKETENAQNLRIEWQGSFVPRTDGEHQFRMYSSGYAQLWIDDEQLLNRWRMNWNPWYHDTQMVLKAGEKHRIKVAWTPQGGYFHLFHRDPLPAAERDQISFASETGKAIDYYVVAGPDADALIAGYRRLTGKAVMLPRWAYGFWQSRERYKSQAELLAALKEYRDRKIPIDNIVLDWSYWPEDAWGSHDFDKQYFPDPKAMVERVHALNAQIMISVWPKFYPTTENYRQLDDKGYMLNRNIEEGNLDWIGKGYLNAFYDAFNPGARKLYWQQLNSKINVYGFDAWWLDAVEPDMHSNVNWDMRKAFMTPNHLGSGAEVFNAYAVPHAEGVYQGDRAAEPDKRVFILTRSGFGGIQRTASAIWSGDTVSRWSNLREQIAAGIGTGLAGMPNWTFDIGGFTPEDRFRYNAAKAGAFVGSYRDMAPAELPEWQELNLRWFQFGAFAPLFRSHGQNPYREIYNLAAEGSDVYNSLVGYTQLRYRLLPYIYSIAGDMYHKDATLMRGLVMDFPSDATARNLNDEYMFGPAFLVSPVYEMGARKRAIYLPEGTSWLNFYTGERMQGGQTIIADAPLTRMPLFVRAGAIVPTGPAVQFADQLLNAPLTLNVYTGADGVFELYEDDGRSYGYEKGEWSRIPMRYNEDEGSLTLGRRIGQFPGMAETREIRVRWLDGTTGNAADFEQGVNKSVTYTGEEIVILR